jgi:hypothetical protein
MAVEPTAGCETVKCPVCLERRSYIVSTKVFLSSSKTNTAGAGSFPSNQCDLRLDGGVSNDIHNRIFFGGQ